MNNRKLLGFDVVVVVVLVLVVGLPQVIWCLKNVVLDIEPRVVQLGQDSTLQCSYDLEEAPLYCVKWYRGHHEFYRYTPKEHPSTKIFPVPGLRVDLKMMGDLPRIQYRCAHCQQGFNHFNDYRAHIEGLPMEDRPDQALPVVNVPGDLEENGHMPPIDFVRQEQGLRLVRGQQNILMPAAAFDVLAPAQAHMLVPAEGAGPNPVQDRPQIVLLPAEALPPDVAAIAPPSPPPSPPRMEEGLNFAQERVIDVVAQQDAEMPAEGAAVDRLEVIIPLKQSNEHQVVLKEVGFNLSGKFTCEVTTDAPLFRTSAVSKDMLVVVLPNHPPTLSTDKSFYDTGDVLRANCSSPPSRPAAILTFYINDNVTCEKCETRKHPAQELWWSELSLEIPLFPSHIKNGRLILKCVAKIGDLYERAVEVSLYQVKDPIPARVTQSGSGSTRIYQTAAAVLLSSMFVPFLP